MARIVTDGAIGIVLADIDTSAKHALGHTVVADSGLYVYCQFSGAVAAGGVCKISSAFVADAVDTTESGSTAKIIGVALAAAADTNYGWLWRGMGVESVLVAASVSADTALTTTATAGTAGTGGDAINNLVTVGSTSGAAAVITCASAELLSTN